MTKEPVELAEIPADCVARANELRADAHAAWLVGEGLARLIRPIAPELPPARLELLTTASPAQVLERFEAALPIWPAARLAMLPAHPAPIDLRSLPPDHSLGEHLAHCGLTIHAMAWDPVSGELIDPHDGLEDLRYGRLRAVGNPRDRLAEQPLRLVRVARLVAERGFAVEPSLEEAMRGEAATAVAAPRVSLARELSRLLLAPHAGAALALLRRTGVEAVLVPNARADTASLLDSLPRLLAMRLAAWLRGPGASKTAHRLGFGSVRRKEVQRLLDHHPLDARVNPHSEAGLLRIDRRLLPEEIAALLQLREHELDASDAEARARLAEVRKGLARARANAQRKLVRRELALDGQAVMQALGCGPGRRVGEALRHLAAQVEADPACNTPDALLRHLYLWAGS